MTDTDLASPVERRRYERLDRKFDIRYRRLDEMFAVDCDRKATLCDFGGGGVRFVGKEKLEKNQQVVVRIEFSGWKAEGDEWVHTGNDGDSGVLKAIGRVMWSALCKHSDNEYEVGVMFTGRMK